MGGFKRICIKNRAAFALVFALCTLLGAGCDKRKSISPTPDMDSAEELWIRVLLFDNLTEFVLSTQEGFVVRDEKGEQLAEFGKGCGPVLTAVLDGPAPLAEFCKGCGPVLTAVLDGKILIGEHVFEGTVSIEPAAPHVFSLGEELYRGNLILTPKAETESFRAVNSLPVESYLAGVVGSEMPSYWEIEALKAQTVAARTYCLFIKYRFGQGRSWDVRRSQANQVYGGVAAESPMIWDAINATSGDVLACDQEGVERIFPTYYSSTCGGHTENSKRVFGDSYVSLEGVKCPYCRDVTRKSFYDWKQVKFDAAVAGQRIINRYPRFKTLEKIVNIEAHEVNNCGDFTRVASLILTGRNGRKKTLRAEDLRLTIDSSGRKIKSNSYKIVKDRGYYVFSSGRGFGHSVGMCQYGAEGMARKGKDYRKILAFYYPESKIRNVY